jgi:hypothetical protein
MHGIILGIEGPSGGLFPCIHNDLLVDLGKAPQLNQYPYSEHWDELLVIPDAVVL